MRGKAPDESTIAGRAFLPALPYVPRPRSGTAEGKFELTLGKLGFRGMIDLACTVGDLPDAAEFDYAEDVPVVIDYKSVKSLGADKMLKDEAEFLNDPQAIVYATKRLVQSKSKWVVLRWIYLRRAAEWDGQEWKPKGKPKAQPQTVVLSREQVEDAFRRIIFPLANQLVQIKLTKPDPLSLPANADSCMRYGPKYACPRIGQCNLSPMEKITMARDLLAELDSEEETQVKEEPKKAAPAPKAGKGINPPPLNAEPARNESWPGQPPDSVVVEVHWYNNKGRSGRCSAHGATLDEALKAACSDLPR